MIKGHSSIVREQQATIGRYALDVEGSEEPATISFTRPRQHVIYLTCARAPNGDAGQDALDTLIDAVASEAAENNDRIVLANRQMEDLFGEHPRLNKLQ